MNKNLLALAAIALAVGGAATAYWLVSTSDAPTAAQGQAATRASARDADLSAPAEAGGSSGESALESKAGDSERADVDAANLVWIQGSVRLPAGTPADELIEIWAFTDNSDPTSRARELSRQSVVDAEHDNVVARCEVASDGAFRCAVPRTKGELWLVLAGRYCFSDAGVRIDTAGEQGELSARFEPRLGAWVTGRLLLPVEASADLIDRDKDQVELEIDGLRMSGSGNVANLGDVRSRDARVDQSFAFEFRGVVGKRAYRAQIEPSKLAALRTDSFMAAPGEHVVLEPRLAFGGTLIGTVRDNAGAPVPGAHLEASIEPLAFGQGGFEVRDGKSIAGGTFALEAVAAGAVRLKVEADGYLERTQEIALADRQRIEGLEIVLERGNTISGRVTWADGRAAPKVKVKIEFDASQLGGMGAFNAMQGAEGQAESQSDGSFEVTGLGKGPFTVKCSASVEADDKADALADETSGDKLESLDDNARDKQLWRARADHVKPNTRDVALVLSPPQGVAGRVVDREGQPVAKFTVVARTQSEGMIPGLGVDRVAQDFSVENGEFFLEGLSSGAWELGAFADGFAPSANTPLSLPLAVDAARIELVLERVATVSGTVLQKGGAPAVGAVVKVKQDVSAFMRGQIEKRKETTATSDESGHFTLDDVAAGTVSLVATADGSAESEPVVVELTPGQQLEDVVLRLRDGGTITGEVFGDDGKPIAGAALMANTSSDPLSQRWSNADSAGRFEFLHVVPGSWNVIYMPSQSKTLGAGGDGVDTDDANNAAVALFAEMKMTLAKVVEGETTHVVLGAPPRNPVRVHGLVKLDDRGVGGLLVSFIRDGGKGLEQMQFTTSASDGAYSTELKEPGGYLVSVQRTGASGEQQTVSSYVRVPDQPEFAHDIELPLGGISGRVRDANGAPAKGVRVSLVRDGAIPSSSIFGEHFAEITTDADGAYELLWLKPGAYTVGVGGQPFGGLFGGAAETTPPRELRSGLQVKENEWLRGVDFKLATPGTIRGAVRDASGKPLAGAALFVRDEQGRLLERLSMSTTDSSGRFEMPGLLPGEYALIARNSTQVSPDETRVQVNASAVTDVELQVGAGTMLIVSLSNSQGDAVDCSVEVTDEDGHQVNGMMSLEQIQSALAEGGFSSREQGVGPLAPGKYRVVATAKDGRSASRSVSLTGQTKRTLKLEL